MNIDWTDPNGQITEHFSVREAIWLPQWRRLAAPGDGFDSKIESALQRFLTDFMEPVRWILGKAISVHCCYRPTRYNEEIGGAKDSAHICLGDWAAMDFSCPGMNCDDIRATLEGQLINLNLRMEKRPGSNWVHLDNKPPLSGGNRYFLS